MKCSYCNAVLYEGEALRQFNMRLKEYKLCLKYIPKSSYDMEKKTKKRAEDCITLNRVWSYNRFKNHENLLKRF